MRDQGDGAGEGAHAGGGSAQSGGEPAPASAESAPPGGGGPSSSAHEDPPADRRGADEVEEIFYCDLCGNVMLNLHCKLICERCGYKRDCSDP